MPRPGAYTYLQQLIVDRLIPTHPWTFTAIALVTGVIALWLSPWPVDAVIAVSAASAWTGWLEEQDRS